ncbi:alpha/beta fold hydrolase [Promicromonospora sp. CA-289599]|uniref:alpha/beta fold hydrolase n=1 Tax=Promicromonospora sp. CA-289599 TaxID=3240014 RepID=UPI003D8B92B8
MALAMNSRPTFLLVHGAWHGSWTWGKLKPILEADGWATRTVDLPSAGDPAAGIHDDARTVRQALDRIQGPVIVVGHSYGGIPVTQAVAEATNVTHVVYLSAYQLDVGESLWGSHGAPVPEEPEGLTPVANSPLNAFYVGMSDDEAEAAVQRLVPQSVRSFAEPLTQAGWRTTPSTYIVCEHDLALPAEYQETLAVRSGRAHRMAWGHSPFLTEPADLAGLLARIALEAVDGAPAR